MDYLSKTQLETPHMVGKNLLIILQVKNSLDIHYYTITWRLSVSFSFSLSIDEVLFLGC